MERIAVRSGDHPGYSRLVFDWPHKVEYELSVDQSAVTLTFAEPATINMAALRADDPNWLRDIAASESADGLVFSFTIADRASVFHFRDGTKVVVDVVAPVDAVKIDNPEPVQRPAIAADAIPADVMAADTMDQATSQEPMQRPDIPEATMDQATLPEPMQRPDIPEAMMDRAEAPEPVDAVPESVSPAMPEAAPAVSPVASVAKPAQELTRPANLDLQYSGAPVAVRAEPVFNGVRLTYPLAEPLPSAVFQRAGYLWVIFEKYRPVDHAGLGAIAGGRILKIEQIPHPNATILRYRIAGGQHVVAHRRDAAWVVELKENLTAPKIPLEIGQHRYNGGPAVFLPVANVGSRVDITDPEVGDTITVVPVLPAGRGVADTRRFAQFQVIKSAQGVAVEILADGVLVERFRNGIAISTSGGLALSLDHNAPTYVGVEEGKADTPDKPQRLVDFAAWRRGGPGDFDKNRHELLHRLSMAPDEERNGVRWDLARFYLSHGMSAVGLGILEIMVTSDPDLLDNAEYRATRGVAYIQLRRFQDARNDLALNGLDSESDAYLWRALAAAGLGQWQEALDNYRRGSDVLSTYEEPERVRFEMAALKAAEQLGNAEIMKEEIKVLDGFLLPPHESAEVEYLRAKMYLHENQHAEAMESLARVEAAGQRPSAAHATFSRIKIQLANNEMAEADAIDQLERLRFSWRGDKFELDLLDRLGQLYIADGDYRTGFNILRQAVTHFPKSPRTREISAVMGKAFQHLFLDGQADAMPPIEALALYYDYRELTPLGADGDQMIRRLADRLVAVDLLDRAAELLEHQVRYRLEGVAQAQVAGRLAMIYLLDRKPDKALAVLRATRQTIIPNDVERRRRYLEARALIDLERYEEGEVLLEGDSSPEAELLRADLYWGAGRWKDVVANGEAVLGSRWEEAQPLSNDERRQILRMAVAQSLDDNAGGLEALRKQYGAMMADGAYASAFDVITAQQDPSEREIKELTESIASVNRLEGFMASYRDEFNGS